MPKPGQPGWNENLRGIKLRKAPLSRERLLEINGLDVEPILTPISEEFDRPKVNTNLVGNA